MERPRLHEPRPGRAGLRAPRRLAGQLEHRRLRRPVPRRQLPAAVGDERTEQPHHQREQRLHGVTAAQAYYTGNKADFSGMNALELEKLARGIGFRDGDVNTDNDVHVSDVTTSSYTLKCRSRSGITFIATGDHLKVTYNF